MEANLQLLSKELMAYANQEGKLFHKCKELHFFPFLYDIRKEPGGLFTISIGQLAQRPTNERKVEPKKGRQNQNILPSPHPQIKRIIIEIKTLQRTKFILGLERSTQVCIDL